MRCNAVLPWSALYGHESRVVLTEPHGNSPGWVVCGVEMEEGDIVTETGFKPSYFCPECGAVRIQT